MYQIAKPLFLYCETPLHAGSGSELGIVDLPIQRERHTGFPKIESSSLKGALRERVEDVFIHKNEIDRKDKKREHAKVYDVFGPDGDSGELYAGAIGFTDARLLLFPVKSMKGVFAWVTCGQILKRFIQDLETCKVQFPVSKFPNVSSSQALITSTSELKIGESIVLEEYAFAAKPDDHVSELANWLMNNLLQGNPWWQQKIGRSLVVLHDDDFKDFVELSTEVITRTKIDNESGTVADGALFTEEYLPSESVLYSLVLAAPVLSNGNPEKKQSDLKKAEDVMNFFAETLAGEHFHNRFQAGANATLGKGHIRTTLI